MKGRGVIFASQLAHAMTNLSSITAALLWLPVLLWFSAQSSCIFPKHLQTGKAAPEVLGFCCILCIWTYGVGEAEKEDSSEAILASMLGWDPNTQALLQWPQVHAINLWRKLASVCIRRCSWFPLSHFLFWTSEDNSTSLWRVIKDAL